MVILSSTSYSLESRDANSKISPLSCQGASFFRVSLTVDIETPSALGGVLAVFARILRACLSDDAQSGAHAELLGLHHEDFGDDEHVSILTPVHVSDESPLNVSLALNYFLDIVKKFWNYLLPNISIIFPIFP